MIGVIGKCVVKRVAMAIKQELADAFKANVEEDSEKSEIAIMGDAKVKVYDDNSPH